jgi:hypothetical protein
MDETALPDNDLTVAALVVGALLVVAYSVLIAGQILVVVWFAATALTLWLAYRFVVAVETIANAQQRLADAASDETPPREP